MKVLVSVKRVIDYNVTVRVKFDGSVGEAQRDVVDEPVCLHEDPGAPICRIASSVCISSGSTCRG